MNLLNYSLDIVRWMLRRRRLFIFVIAFTVRLICMAKLHIYRDLDRYELERTAISLASTGVYGNPYIIPTGPTAHVSPGYTLMLASIFRAFGTGEKAEIVKNVVAAAVTASECSLLPYFSQSLGIGLAPGLIAAVYRATVPIKPLIEIQGDWENTYTAISIILFISMTRRIWRRGQLSLLESVLSGMFVGLSLLFSAVLLPFFCIVPLIQLFIVRSVPIRSRVVYAVTQTIVAGLCLSPWIIRNEIVLGKPLVGRSNLGLELRLSNNDFATADQRINFLNGLYDHYHPLQNIAEAEQVRRLGEVEYNRRCSAEAVSWIKSHPARFLALTLGRIRCFWFYPEAYLWRSLIDNFIMVMGLLGLVLLGTRNRVSAILVTAGLFCYSSPSYLIHVGTRQSYPFQSIMAVLAAFLAVSAFSFLQQQKRASDTVPLERANQ